MDVSVGKITCLKSPRFHRVVGDDLVDNRRVISNPLVVRPALGLAGYAIVTKGQVILFDKDEMAFLESLDSNTAVERLQAMITSQTAAVVITEGTSSLLLQGHCQATRTPLWISQEPCQKVWIEITSDLESLLAPTMEIHATLVDVYGLGVLLTGPSGVGKSETALGLIERRHRLVCDDLVCLKQQGQHLMGMGHGFARHHMEVRGIGIVNVAHLFGVVSVMDQKRIDLAVQLEPWSDDNDYDRLGLEWSYCEWLEVKVPHHRLPVKPGRDPVLLIETLALHHRLRAMGYHSAKELSLRLEEEISRKTKG